MKSSFSALQDLEEDYFDTNLGVDSNGVGERMVTNTVMRNGVNREHSPRRRVFTVEQPTLLDPFNNEFPTEQDMHVPIKKHDSCSSSCRRGRNAVNKEEFQA